MALSPSLTPGCRHQYGLTLSSTNAALEALGLLGELRQRDVPSRSHWVFRHDGEVLGYFGNAFAERRPLPERGNMRVPRQVLRQMLLDRLEPQTVTWGCKLEAFAERPGGVTLTFACGRVVEAAALVGADGIHSLVRRCREPRAAIPEYLGVLAVVGLSEHSHALLHERGFYTVDGCARLFTMPYSEPTPTSKALTMWQLSIRLPEGEARALAAAGDAPLLEELSRRVRHWRKCSPFSPGLVYERRLKESSNFSKRSCRADAPVPDLLQHTQDLWAAPLCDAPPPPPPAKGATSVVTLVGDAAHPMVSTDRMFLFCFSLPFGLLK